MNNEEIKVIVDEEIEKNVELELDEGTYEEFNSMGKGEDENGNE